MRRRSRWRRRRIKIHYSQGSNYTGAYCIPMLVELIKRINYFLYFLLLQSSTTSVSLYLVRLSLNLLYSMVAISDFLPR